MSKYVIIKKDNGLMDLTNNGNIVLENLTFFYRNSKDKVAIFEKNLRQGWIKDDGTILADNLFRAYNFSCGIGKFKRTDGTEGRIRTDGSIMMEGIEIINDFDPEDSIAIFKRKDGTYGLIRNYPYETEKILIDGAKMIEKDKIEPFHYIIDDVPTDVTHLG